MVLCYQQLPNQLRVSVPYYCHDKGSSRIYCLLKQQMVLGRKEKRSGRNNTLTN